MIPQRIREFLGKIISETNLGNLHWERERDGNFDVVSTQYQNLLIVIADGWDGELGLPKIFVNLYYTDDNSSTSFSAYEEEDGYTTAKNTHSVAIASTLDLPI